MPRKARLDAPGVLHHVIIRGIERRKIFMTDGDREDFLERVSKLLLETGTVCYAWVFIPNHAHFLFRTGSAPLSLLMRRLLTGYVVSFNHRHERCGQLFQNRYKSILCQEDAYLKELVRYIHLNPVRAGIVKDISELNEYPYCGHSALMGRRERGWQDVAYVLRYFGEMAGTARAAYLGYMEKGIGLGRREELTGGGLIRSAGGWAEVNRMKQQTHVMSDERILGDAAFVASLLSQANEAVERCYHMKRLGINEDHIIKRVAGIFEMDPADIFLKGKKPQIVAARSLFCYWAVTGLGLSLRELSRRLNLTPPAVGYAVERGKAMAREHGYRLINQ